LAAATRSRLASSEAELRARLEELARAEAAQGDVTSSLAPRMASQKHAVPPAQAQAEVARAREAVVAQFTSARDASLSVDPVNVEALRARLGGGVALLYECSRDSAGWRISGVLVHRERELAFAGLIGKGLAGSPCELLDAIAEKRHEAVARAFEMPMCEHPWPELARQILPAPLATVLRDARAEAPDLVVVPDGPLAAMPFSGLRLVDGRCLLEAARIRMLPSLSLLEDRHEHAQEAREATVVVTHVDTGREALAGGLRMGSSAEERVADGRESLEAALRADPPADLAVILAHGRPGGSPFDAAVRLGDSAMSAAAALRLPWPPAVLLGSCWLGGGDVSIGEEPFGFPIACFLGGSRTVVGALSPVPRREVTSMLARIATELPTALTLGEAVRSAVLPESGPEAWREASAMDWPCMTTWSTVAIAEEIGEDRSTEVRMSRPPSPAARTILELEQERSRRGVVGLAGLMHGICGSDPDCSTLPGAEALAAAAARAPIDTELADRTLGLEANAPPIYLSTGAATALEIAETMAAELGLEEVPSPLLALAASFDERTTRLIAAQPGAEGFADALTDLLERTHRISQLAGDGPSYDEGLAMRMRSQPQRPPSNGLRITRRIGWGAAFLLLGMIGSGLSDAGRLQRALGDRGFLGVRLASAPDGSPEVVEVLAGTAAARAGIHPGDEIEAVDGLSVATTQQAQLRIGRHRPGQTVRLAALRHGGRLELTVRLTPPP
ncbi:MAG TPA: CHAT domain-containing protein, partial [Solirubrobacteraceae bacterium]